MQKVSERYPESIYLDGTEVGIPARGGGNIRSYPHYLIEIEGCKILVPPKSFRLFTLLAWNRLHDATGWVFHLKLEGWDNTSRYLYRLRNEVRCALDFPWIVYENNRSGYYRLYARPESITLNIENLKLFPDSEVTSLLC